MLLFCLHSKILTFFTKPLYLDSHMILQFSQLIFVSRKVSIYTIEFLKIRKKHVENSLLLLNTSLTKVLLQGKLIAVAYTRTICVRIETSSLWADFVNKNRCISVRLVSEEVKKHLILII